MVSFSYPPDTRPSAPDTLYLARVPYLLSRMPCPDVVFQTPAPGLFSWSLVNVVLRLDPELVLSSRILDATLRFEVGQ